MKRNAILVLIAILVLSLTFCAFSTNVIATSATITTNKADYSPEETVTIYGTDFLPNTPITVNITRPDEHVDSSLDEGTNIVYKVTITYLENGQSDEDGNFTATYLLDGIEGTYTVTATDGTNTAETTFTDGQRLNAVAVGSQGPSFILTGDSANFAISTSWENVVFSLSRSATLSVIGGLPAEATPIFSPSTVSDSSPTSTLTISTTSEITPGTYTFTVQAEENGGFPRIRTATGTLVVKGATTTDTLLSQSTIAIGASVTDTATVAPTIPAPSVTYVGSGYADTDTGQADTNTLWPTYPSPLEVDDLILLQLTIRNTFSSPPSIGSGFTLLYGPDTTGTGRQWIYYKFSTGSESGTLQISLVDVSACSMARMYAFRNVALSSFYEGGVFGSGSGSTISAQSVTTAGANRLAVSFVFVTAANALGDFTGEGGGYDWEEAVSEYTTTVGGDGSIQLQTATMAAAGTISGGSYSMGASASWGVRAFALKPAIPLPTGTVTFYVKPDGGSWTSFGYKTLTDGSATCDAYTPASAGTWYFKAVYGGDSYFAGSSSGETDEPLTVTIDILSVFSSDSGGTSKTSFVTDENAYCHVTTGGSGSDTVRLYVVNSDPSPGSSLTDVSGGYETRTITGDSTWLVWSADTNPGTYYIVISADEDGYYDSGEVKSGPFTITTAPVPITFEVSGVDSIPGTETVLTIDGTPYTYSQFSPSLALDGSASGHTTSPPSGNTFSFTLTTTKTNDLLYVVVALHNVDSVTSITSPGLTWHFRKMAQNGVDVKLETWYAVPSTSTSNTITITKSSSGYEAAAVAFGISGVDTASPFDVDPTETHGYFDYSGLHSSSITTTYAHDFIIGALAISNFPTTYPGSGYEIILTDTASTLRRATAEYRIVSEAGTYTPTYDFSSTGWALIADAVKQAPAGSSSITFNWLPGSTHTVTASASLSNHNVFDSWTNPDGLSGAGPGTYTTPGSATTVTANYAATVPITFQTSGIGTNPGSDTVLTIDGTPYTYSQLTPTLALDGSISADNSGNTISMTLSTSNVNDLLYVVLALYPSDSVSSITSTPALTWSFRSSNAAGTNPYIRIETWYAVPSSSTSTAITITKSTSLDAAAVAFGIAGADITSPFDGSAPYKDGYVSSASRSITTTNANDFIIGAIAIDGVPTLTQGGGCSIILSNPVSTLREASAEYRIVSATGTYTPSYTWSLPTNPSAMISDAIKQATGITFYWVPGSTHTVVASTPLSNGGTYGSWTNGDGLSGASGTYTTPSSATAVTANYEPSATSTYRVTFDSSGLGADATGNLVSFSVSGGSYSGATSPIGVAGGYIDVDADATVTYSFVDPVTSSAVGKRYTFDSATGSASGFTVSEDTTITGNYQTQYELTMAQSPAAGATLSPGAGGGHWYAEGATVSISASEDVAIAAGSRYHFNGWTGGGAGSFDSASSASTVFTMPASAVTATANYVTQYYLTVETSPASVDSPTGEGWYDSGATAHVSTDQYVDIVADSSRYRFDSWTGASGDYSDATVSMDAAKTATANYVTQYYLTVNNGGYGTAGGSGYYDNDATAYAIITPLTVSGGPGVQYVFAGWTGDASGSGSPSDGITMDGTKTATATWTDEYELTMAQSPAAGATLSPGAGGGHWYAEGATVSISASENVGTSGSRYYFNGWTSDPSVTFDDASDYSTTFTMPASAVTVTANYVAQYQVTFQYNVIGDASPSAPTVYYTQFGSPATTTASTGTGVSDWVDATTAVSYDNPLSDSGSTERWQAVYSSDSGKSEIESSVTASGTLDVTYYHQFSVSFGYTTNDDSTLDSETDLVAYTQFGSTVYLSTDASGDLSETSDFADAGTSVTYVSPVSGAAGERWQIASGDSGSNAVVASVASGSEANPEYYHQYEITLEYHIANTPAGSPTVTDIVTYTSFGTGGLHATPAYAPTDTSRVWVDATSSVTYTNPIVSGNERWVVSGGATPYVADSSVTASGTLDPTYYHQFKVIFWYTVVGGGSPTAPVVDYTKFGSSQTMDAATDGTAYDWVDAGTAVSYDNPLSDSGTERWQADLTISSGKSVVEANVVGYANLNPTYYHQYLVTFSQTGIDSDARSNTVLTVDTTDYAYDASPSGVWLDDGTTFSWASPVSGGSGKQFVKIDQLGDSPISGAGTYSATYKTQWQVSFHVTGLDGDADTNTVLTVGSTTYDQGDFPVDDVWVDDGTSYLWEDPITVSETERFVQTAGSDGSVTGAGTISASYQKQWLVSFHVSGLDNDAGGNTVLTVDGFSDNFDDGDYSGWSPIAGDPHWSVVSGRLQRSIGVPPYNQQSRIKHDVSYDDYIFEADARLISGAGYSLIFRVSNDLDRYYAFQYDSYGAGSLVLGKFTSYSGGIWSTLATTPFTIDSSWHHLKVSVNGNHIKCYIDSVMVFDVVDGTSPFLSGDVGFRTWYWNPIAEFDNVIVKAIYDYNDFPVNNIWVDDGASYSWTTPISVSSTEQFVQTTGSDGTVTSAGTISASYQKQWKVTFTATGLDIDAGTVTVLTLGGAPYYWNSLPSGVWVDDGTTFSWADPVTVSGTEQFVKIGQSGTSPVSGDAYSASYQKQWKVSFSQTGIDSDAGSETVLTVGTTDYAYNALPSGWFDDATTFTWADPVAGLDANERFVKTDQTGTSPIDGTRATYEATYQKQFQVSFTQTGIDSDAGSNTVLTVGTTDYAYNALPINAWFGDGTTFSWHSPVSGGSGKQFVKTGQTGSSPIDGTRTTYSATYSVSVLTYTGATSGQYSDPVTVSALLTSDGSGVSGVTITFTIGSQSTTAVTGADGSASNTIILNQASGDYTVTASCAGADSTILSVSEDFTINKETATVEYTGDAGMVTVAGATDITRTVRVAAQVTQEDDGHDGDLTKITLEFTIDGYDSESHHYSDSVSGVPVNSAGQAVAFLEGVPIGAYDITVRIEDNSYFTRDEDDNTIAVCDFNPDGYVTGGGWIPCEDSVNGKINFAFVVKYDRRGNPKGSFVAVFKSKDGFTYRIKSTSWAQNKASLTFGNTEDDGSGLPTACLTFGGVVQIVDRATGEVVDSWGNCKFIVDMTDGDYGVNQNGRLDKIAITVIDNTNTVALQWGSARYQVGIGGGNIVVASTKKSSGGGSPKRK